MATTILKLNCPDAVGVLARITGRIAVEGGNLLEVSQYTDKTSGWFFARAAVEAGDPAWSPEKFETSFAQLAAELSASWTMRPADRKRRTAILVSKQDHCLVDLLWRWRSGELGLDIPVVISNHPDCRSLVEREGIPFEHVDFSNDKDAAFQRWGRSCARMTSNWSCWRASCRCCPRGCAGNTTPESSTSTTPSCPLSWGQSVQTRL